MEQKKKLEMFKIKKLALLFLMAFSISSVKNVYAIDIKDVNFKACIEQDDEYKNGIENITKLICKGKNILDLTGIEQLKKIKILDLSQNKIQNINLENNLDLVELNLSDNFIENVNLAKNKILEKIYLNNVQAKDITLPIYDDTNILKVLDLTLNNITDKQVQSYLDTFTNLKEFYSKKNNHKVLDFSKQINLEKLILNNNELSNLILPLSDLKILDIAVNNLKTLDVSKYLNLEELYVSSNNGLLDLDITKNINLKLLDSVFSGFSKSIDISKNLALEYSTIDYDFIKNIDLSKFTNLKKIASKYFEEIKVNEKSIAISEILKHVPKEITYGAYEVFNDFTIDKKFDSDIVDLSEFPISQIRIRFDDAKNSNVQNSDAEQVFEGYYKIVYVEENKEETPNPVCSEKNGKYYDKNGNDVSKEAYFESCGVVENPQTGLYVSIGLITILGIASLVIMIKSNKTKMYKL